MGYERKSDPKHINSSLKQEVARWACAFGSLECKKQAYFILKSHLMQEKYKYFFYFFYFYDTNSFNICAVYTMLTKLSD